MDLELAEHAGYRDTFAAAPERTAARHGIDHVEVAGALCTVVRSVRGSRIFNHVTGLGRSAAATEGQLDRIAGFYGDATYFVALAPDAQPPDLADRLAARGFAPDYAWMKFRRGVDDPPQLDTDLRVEPIGREHADAFGRIVAAGFTLPDFTATWVAAIVGRPGWTCFLAFAGDVPVATGALFVIGGSGWLTWAATRAESRGRGAQNALLAARIRAAAARGCRTLVCETGEAVEGRPSSSYRNIVRAGFDQMYVRPNLRSPPA